MDADGKPHYKCPRREIDEPTLNTLRLYDMAAETGALPREGGTLAQSNLFLQAFSYIRSRSIHVRRLKQDRDDAIKKSQARAKRGIGRKGA